MLDIHRKLSRRRGSGKLLKFFHERAKQSKNMAGDYIYLWRVVEKLVASYNTNPKLPLESPSGLGLSPGFLIRAERKIKHKII